MCSLLTEYMSIDVLPTYWIRCLNLFKIMWPNDATEWHKAWPLLVHVMTCCLFINKWLCEPMLTCYQFNLYKDTKFFCMTQSQWYSLTEIILNSTSAKCWYFGPRPKNYHIGVCPYNSYASSGLTKLYIDLKHMGLNNASSKWYRCMRKSFLKAWRQYLWRRIWVHLWKRVKRK